MDSFVPYSYSLLFDEHHIISMLPFAAVHFEKDSKYFVHMDSIVVKEMVA